MVYKEAFSAGVGYMKNFTALGNLKKLSLSIFTIADFRRLPLIIKTIIGAGLTLAIMYTIICLVQINNLPNEIMLTENTEHRLAFDSRALRSGALTATIQSETVSVLKVNSTTVDEAVTVNLHNPVRI